MSIRVNARTVGMNGKRLATSTLLALAAPAALAQSDGPALFVGNNGNLEGSVTAFRINADGTLQFANRLITGVRATTSDPCAGCNAYEISLSPDGRHIVSAHASGSLDGLTFFRVNADATLTQLLQLALPTGQGTPLDATWIDNERIAVTRTDTSPDRIVVYRFNPTVPSITELTPNTFTTGNSLAYLAMHPSGDYLYANDSGQRTVTVYAVGADHLLTLIDTEPTGLPFPLELAISRDGSRLYSSCGISNNSDKVLGFAVAGDGTLSPLPNSPFLSQGDSPSNVFVNDSGTHLVVGHGADATARTMSINPATGELTSTGFMFDVGTQGTLGDVRAMGDHVFVTDNSTIDGQVGIYSFTLGAAGELTANGPIVPSQGIGPRSMATWSGPVLPCPGDISPQAGDGEVNVDDLLVVIKGWGPCADPNNCPADIAPRGGDDNVNVDDLQAIINTWGACP